MDSVFKYPHLISLALTVAASTLFFGWQAERRRSNSDWGEVNAVIQIILAMVFMLFYCFVAYLVPATILVVILETILSTPSSVSASVITSTEIIAQFATLFAVGGNFADLASTYGKTSFFSHIFQYLFVVPAGYYATIFIAWLGAHALAMIGTYETADKARASRLFGVPSFTSHTGSNIALVVTLFLAEGVVSFFLRKRGEER